MENFILVAPRAIAVGVLFGFFVAIAYNYLEIEKSIEKAIRRCLHHHK